MRRFLLVVFFVTSAFAQTQQPAAPTGQAPAPAPSQEAVSQDSAAQAAGAEAVLAEARDYKLTEAEFGAIIRLLPTQGKSMTPEQKQDLIRRWMMVIVFAEEAKAGGAEKDPEFIRELDLQKKQALFSRYQRELLASVQPVTPDEALKYYEENKKVFQRPATARVNRILLPTKEKADEANQELRSGQAFEEVAKTRSIDGASKDKGGDLGWVSAGVTEPAFDQVVFSLGVNQVSEPFETKLGWQIVKVTEKKEAVQIEFLQVRDRLSQELTTRKQRETIEAKAAELFQKHGVKIQGNNK